MKRLRLILGVTMLFASTNAPANCPDFGKGVGVAGKFGIRYTLFEHLQSFDTNTDAFRGTYGHNVRLLEKGSQLIVVIGESHIKETSAFKRAETLNELLALEGAQFGYESGLRALAKYPLTQLKVKLFMQREVARAKQDRKETHQREYSGTNLAALREGSPDSHFSIDRPLIIRDELVARIAKFATEGNRVLLQQALTEPEISSAREQQMAEALEGRMNQLPNQRLFVVWMGASHVQPVIERLTDQPGFRSLEFDASFQSELPW